MFDASKVAGHQQGNEVLAPTSPKAHGNMHVNGAGGLDDPTASTEPWRLPPRTLLAELFGIEALPPTGLVTTLNRVFGAPRSPKGALQFDTIGGELGQRVGVDDVITMGIAERIESRDAKYMVERAIYRIVWLRKEADKRVRVARVCDDQNVVHAGSYLAKDVGAGIGLGVVLKLRISNV